MGGPAPFYRLQDIHDAQGQPPDPTGDMTQYDQQAQPVPDMGMSVDPNAPPPMMGAPTPAPQMPPTQPGPPTAPPASPMGPMGPVATPPPTGDLTQNVPDLQTRMQQYLAMTQRVYGGMKQPEYTPEEVQDRPHGVARFLADVFTMGRTEDAWNARAAQRSWHNQQVRQHNAQMDYRAFDEAHKLMQADQNAQLAQANFGLRQQHASLEMLRAQAAENDRQLTNYIRSLDAQHKQQQIDMDTPFAGGTSTPGGMPPSTGGYEPPAPGSPLADLGDEDAPSAPTTAPTTPTAGAAAPSTIRPGETPRDFVKRRAGEEKIQSEARKQRILGADEITRNADLVEAHFTPELDAAINKVLPDTGGMPGVVARAQGAFNASRYNPMPGGFRNLAAKGDPDVARIQSMVTAAIPFIRAVAGGTKGIRLTQTELSLLTADNLQALATGSVPKDQAHAIIGALKSVLARARATATGDTTTTTTPTTTSTTTTTDPIESILQKHGY